MGNTYKNQAVLNNPTLGFTSWNPSGATTPPPLFPGWNQPGSNTNTLPLAYVPTQQAMLQLSGNGAYPSIPYYSGAGPANYPFTLDGRWLHAFNGPGQGNSFSTVTGLPYSYYGNFRYNLALNVPGPNTVGMDEDYDACDLENWFLAIQSADGQVMIPSFHRPGILRYNGPTGQKTNNPLDWSQAFRFPNGLFGIPNYDSLGRILRPVAADGHDANTFPDLIPDANTGKIAYDVDNDGDGITDSVWLDLGYPARRDTRGQLNKPLFAFMVIGLNGRIPLNTAGNLAGRDPATVSALAAQAQHLGNSVSEIDPQYALQNAYQLRKRRRSVQPIWEWHRHPQPPIPSVPATTYWGSPTTALSTPRRITRSTRCLASINRSTSD